MCVGNFIFLNDAAIPIQTQSALLRVVQEHPNGKYVVVSCDCGEGIHDNVIGSTLLVMMLTVSSTSLLAAR